MLGVDLSSKMVDKCRATGAYHEVRVQDVHEALGKHRGALDLVLSADTFIYVGQLDRAFELCAAALRPGGLFAFSVEELAPDDDVGAEGFKLLRSGRYSQSDAYVRRLARRNGMEVRSQVPVAIRTEQTVPIMGFVYVLEKCGGPAVPSDDGRAPGKEG
jgi:predicted TPR repeat methyltransferase